MPLRRKPASCSSSWTGASLSLSLSPRSPAGACAGCRGDKQSCSMEPLSINYLKYQTAHKRAVDLFVWLWWSERFQGKEKSINVKRVRKGLFIPEDLGEKLDHLSPERFISIIIHRPGSPILCSTMLLNNNQQEKCLQFSRWKGVQRIRFTYFEVKEDFLAQKDKHSRR